MKTSVRLHLDQMMRTRNFRVGSEVVERGAVTKSHGGAKGFVALPKSPYNWVVCVSEDSYPRKSILREEGKYGTKHAVKFSKGTWRAQDFD